MSAPEIPYVEGVDHHELIVRGLRRHVATAGPEDGLPVYLHHGWPQHFYEFRHLIPRLAAAGYRVVAPDSRGFGWTEHPPDEDFSHAAFVEDVVAVCGELGLERIRFVGHDWGCWFGFLLCLEHPELVDRALLMSAPHPWPPPPAPDLETIGRFASLAYQAALAAPATPRRAKAALFRFLMQSGHAARFEPDELEAYLAPLSRPAQVRASTLLYRNTLLRELAPIAKGRFADRRLAMPVSYLIGDADPLFDEPVFRALPEHGDHVSTEVVPGAGHFLPEEAPELVAERVLAFL